MKRRGLLLVLSDFYDDEERTLAELRRAARMGHEVVLFQILSRDEIELPYRRDLEFTDLETGRTLAINAGLARREYKDAVAAFLERWRSRAGAEGFQYSLIVTDTRAPPPPWLPGDDLAELGPCRVPAPLPILRSALIRRVERLPFPTLRRSSPAPPAAIRRHLIEDLLLAVRIARLRPWS